MGTFIVTVAVATHTATVTIAGTNVRIFTQMLGGTASFRSISPFPMAVNKEWSFVPFSTAVIVRACFSFWKQEDLAAG